MLAADRYALGMDIDLDLDLDLDLDEAVNDVGMGLEPYSKIRYDECMNE